MPHTDTNISRDALQNYGMQPTRGTGSEWSGQSRGSGRRIRIYGDRESINSESINSESINSEGINPEGINSEDINPAKVYVDVLAEFTREGFMRPCRITWEDGRKYTIDRVKRCERRASRKAGGMGLMYTCMVAGQEVNLFYEENQRWFVTRK